MEAPGDDERRCPSERESSHNPCGSEHSERNSASVMQRLVGTQAKIFGGSQAELEPMGGDELCKVTSDIATLSFVDAPEM